MNKVEILSWFFVYKEWNKFQRLPTQDKGFEETYREYLYNNLKFDLVSDTRDIGFGLSYSTLSSVNHELDIIVTKENSKFVFELKHYEVSDITKELIFSFLGKVIDFCFKNPKILLDYRITMLFLTTNKNINDIIRKLCIVFGIKLIEPSLMTLETLDYFSRDLYKKIPEENDKLKLETEELINFINELKDICDYSFSDIFKYKEDKIEIDLQFFNIEPSEILDKIKKSNEWLWKLREAWYGIKN